MLLIEIAGANLGRSNLAGTKRKDGLARRENTAQAPRPITQFFGSFLVIGSGFRGVERL